MWQLFLRNEGHNVSFRKSLYRWEFSELKRFVPGNVWSFLSRAALFEDLGVPKTITAKGLVYEIELVILGSAILSILSLPLIASYFGLNLMFTSSIYILIIMAGVAFLLFQNKLPIGKLKTIIPELTFSKNLQFLLFYIAACFFFGAGTFLSAVSIIDLSFSNLFQYVGFFSFSLLVGYLSVITPSGLGVREAVITFGLAKLILLPQAALIAIFSRIALIISELLFAFVTYLLANPIQQTLNQTQGFIRKYLYEILLGIMFVFYNFYFILASFLKYENYYNGRFDLGNMAQTVWNTFHGNIFMLTDPNGIREISRLAFHADFILILLSPLYFIWEDPRMLLLIQTIVLSFGGIFVYLIAIHLLKNKIIALSFALCFFINPAINYTNLFDFHAVTLATTFLLGAFYFILKSNYKAVILFLIFAGITKEQIWAVVALFGLYLAFINKQKVLGLSIFAASSIIFYLLIWKLIPNALGGEHFATQFFGEFGDSPGDIIKSMLLHPIQTIQTLLMPDRISYIKQLFLPLGYLSLAAFPFLIFAGPDLLINLLSGSPQMHQIYYQYSAAITPFIFISGVYAVYFITNKTKVIPIAIFSGAIVLFSIISAYDYGPLPFAKKPTDSMFKEPLVVKQKVNDYIQTISPDAAISASNNLGSHLSHRNRIFTIPVGIEEADQVMFLITKGTNQKEKDALLNIQLNSEFELEMQEQNFYVFKRIVP